MNTWEKICKKHKFHLDKLDVAVIGCAIKTNLWIKLYESLATTNNCNFKLIFCGHISPNFDLPKNLVYINSSMSAAACNEIAYRVGMSMKPKYIMNFQDDLVPSDGLLDSLISELESHEGELIVGPAFRPKLNSGPINLDVKSPNTGLSLREGSERGLGLNYPMMKYSTAQSLGSVHQPYGLIDKRFSGVYWESDAYLRLEMLTSGSMRFKVCENVSVGENEHENRNVHHMRLSLRSMSGFKFYLSQWPHTGKSTDPQFEMPLRRSSPVQYYTNDELLYTINTAGQNS